MVTPESARVMAWRAKNRERYRETQRRWWHRTGKARQPKSQCVDCGDDVLAGSIRCWPCHTLRCEGLNPAPLLARFNGHTVTEIARLLDVNRSTVKRWRAGRNGVRRNRAARHAETAGASFEDLWPEEEL